MLLLGNREIDLCLFDAYGTLFDVTAAAAEKQSELGDQWQALSSLWRTKQIEYTWLRSLMGSHADFWQVTGDALDFAMDTLGMENPRLREELMMLYKQLSAYPEVRGVLAKLRDNGVRAAILSNGSPEMLGSAVKNAGIEEYLEDVLSVESVGIFKVHASVYQLAVDRLGVPAERICFFSSNGWDIAGASHFGYRVVWVNRFGQKKERVPHEIDAEIASLDELENVLVQK